MQTGSHDNLLCALHPWALGQDENFTTDTFGHLLRHLISEDPKAAARILASVTGRGCWGTLLRDSARTPKVEILTHEPGEEGVPDIKMKAHGVLVYIEVKTGSDVDPDQLRRYRAELDRAEEHEKALVLLTQKPVNLNQLPIRPDKAVRWFQVAEWLEKELGTASAERKSIVTAYLIRQFIGFLKARGMAMEKVGKQLTEGVRSLVALRKMLREAPINSGADSTSAGVTVDYHGVFFSIGKAEYWAGVYLAEPGILTFEAYGVGKDCAEEIGFGSVTAFTPDKKNGYGWCNWLDMASERTRFFARTKSSQMQCIEQFLRESIQACAPALGHERKGA